VDPILHPHPRDPKRRGWQYWGCFLSTSYLGLKTPVIAIATTMSANVCINACVAAGNDFAVLRGAQCYCANDLPPGNQGTNKCTQACANTATDFCGNSLIGTTTAAMSVFKRVVSSVVVPMLAHPTNYDYSGCFFADAWINTIFPGPNGFTTTLSSGADGSSCSALCDTKGAYLYAALFGDRCYCTNITIGATAALWAGDGQCTTACTLTTGEACGGMNSAANTMVSLYVRRPSAPSTSSPDPGTTGSQGWYNYGCYFGGLYLLDTILTGMQVSSLLDGAPDMSGDKCIAICRAANNGYSYAMTLSGICFCNNKPPTNDLRVTSQLLCALPCPNHLTTERCGGESTNGPYGRSVITMYGEDPPPDETTSDVSGISVLALFLLCLVA
jgi:hypothetical protein